MSICVRTVGRGACDTACRLHGLLVLGFDDGEGLQKVVRVVTPDAVKVEVGDSSLRWKGVAFNTQERVIFKPMYTA